MAKCWRYQKCMQNFDEKFNLTECIRFLQLSQGKNAKFSVRHNIFFSEIQATYFGLLNSSIIKPL